MNTIYVPLVGSGAGGTAASVTSSKNLFPPAKEGIYIHCKQWKRHIFEANIVVDGYIDTNQSSLLTNIKMKRTSSSYHMLPNIQELFFPHPSFMHLIENNMRHGAEITWTLQLA